MGTRWLLHGPVVTLIREWNHTTKYTHAHHQSDEGKMICLVDLYKIWSVKLLIAAHAKIKKKCFTEENHFKQLGYYFTFLNCSTLVLMDVHVTFAIHFVHTHWHTYTQTHVHTHTHASWTVGIPRWSHPHSTDTGCLDFIDWFIFLTLVVC